MKKILLATALLFSGSLFAQAIGPAGCGLGNMLIGGSENQIFAATVNGTGVQSVGITLGTSNCVDGSGMAKLESFVDGNRVALETEAARGQGETLDSVAQILKCTNAEKVNQALKASHSEIFSGNSTEVSHKMIDALRANEVLCLSKG